MTGLFVIGIGEDGVEGLSRSAHDILDDADVVFGGRRHLAMLGEHVAEQALWSKDLSDDVTRIGEMMAERSVVVLASGDPMLHGIGVRLVERFGIDAMTIIPGVSAFSLAASRMGWALSDPMVSTISIHALPFETLARCTLPGARLLVLSRNAQSPAEIADYLNDQGYGKSSMTVLERMGGAEERRTDIQHASDGAQGPFDNLNTVAIACSADVEATTLSNVPGLPDDAFDHDKTITKRDVRAITLSALAPKPSDVLWDVGAGNGTVAIEWLRAQPAAYAIAFERNSERAKRIEGNARTLGVPELQVIAAEFPMPVDGFDPEPDAIFVGGGIAADEALIDHCMDALRSGGRLVANAVTLEARARLSAAHQTHGGELVEIGIAYADNVGLYRAMKPAIDVLQWRINKT